MSIASEAPTKSNGFAATAFADVAGAQARSTASLTQAGEIMTQTATAIWQKQKDFLQHEAVETTKGFGALGARRDPAAAAYLDTLHAGTERAVADMREINDLIRGCAWQMFSLYAGLWSRTAPPTKP